MTSQNLVSLTLTDAQLQAVDQALADIETQLSGLIAMGTVQRKKLARMGDKSGAFCRPALSVLAQNPQVVPASLNVADAQSDLETLDRLRPRLQRLARLAERATDTDIALGGDVMRCALYSYALLKVAGRNQGLEGLRKALGTRFAKTSRVVEPQPA
ncbi:MAG: hypothetical protein ACOH1V_01480 [Stenotrophomonas sp.]